MVFLCSFLTALILGALSGLHCYWAAGGRHFLDVAVPESNLNPNSHEPLFRPGPLACSAVAAFLGLSSWVVMAYAEWVPSPLSPLWQQRYLLLLRAIFLLRALGDFHYVGFFKRYKTSKFARNDSYLYSPLCLLLFLMLSFVQTFPKQ